jgi:hypothetical protein
LIELKIVLKMVLVERADEREIMKDEKNARQYRQKTIIKNHIMKGHGAWFM